MSSETAFQRGLDPVLRILLPGRADEVLSAEPDTVLAERIEELASRNSEGLLTPEELDEFRGYVRANKFVAVLRRQAMNFKAGSAA